MPAAASAGDHRPDYVIPRDLDDLMQLYFFLLVVLSLSSAFVPPLETPMEKAALATMCMLGSLFSFLTSQPECAGNRSRRSRSNHFWEQNCSNVK